MAAYASTAGALAASAGFDASTVALDASALAFTSAAGLAAVVFVLTSCFFSSAGAAGAAAAGASVTGLASAAGFAAAAFVLAAVSFLAAAAIRTNGLRWYGGIILTFGGGSFLSSFLGWHSFMICFSFTSNYNTIIYSI